jgi:hypothetical protein
MVDNIDRTQLAIPVEPAKGRQTAKNDFGSVVKRGLDRTLGVMATGANIAVSAIPGGSFVAAVADATSLNESGLPIAEGAGSDSKWQLIQAQERLQEEGFSNSMRLLALQRKMNQETQTYGAISNVMKSRHENAKRAINNIG